MKQKSGEQFLHEQNHSFQNSGGVKDVVSYLRSTGERIPHDPAAKIEAYLGFLANREYVNDGVLTGDEASIDHQIGIASIPLTIENAEAYFMFQAKVAREIGRGGDIRLDTDDGERMAALRILHSDQKEQLREWVAELNSTENNYPSWFKYWMFEQVKRHKDFNEDTGEGAVSKGFAQRSKRDFSLFPTLDRESVSLIYDALVEKLGGQKMGFEYEAMRALLTNAKFSDLYAEAQNYGFKITDSLKEITTGSWHDFIQSDSPEDAEGLSGLVRSYRTGWCTAGRETAAKQLSAGDFYIWCSTNPRTGVDEVPRIAVRMEDGKVAEVRGIVGGRRQELESELTDIVVEKIRDFPGGISYFKKAEDMRLLTVLEKKIRDDMNAELSDEELSFLYELDFSIEGFGYGEDPRIKEIKTMRRNIDNSDLDRLLPDALRRQLRFAYVSYDVVARQLGCEIEDRQAIEELFATKAKEWQTNGVYDYLVEKIASEGVRFNLVATPNVEVSQERLISLSETFVEEYDSGVFIDDDIYNGNYYSNQEWSGNEGTAPIRFSLIPSTLDKEIGLGTVAEQVRKLNEQQAKYPMLNMRVPSVLEAITHWYNLQAKAEKLDGPNADKKTFVRHFDLDPKKTNEQMVVPWTSFDCNCGSILSYFDANYQYDDSDNGVRLAVG